MNVKQKTALTLVIVAMVASIMIGVLRGAQITSEIRSQALEKLENYANTTSNIFETSHFYSTQITGIIAGMPGLYEAVSTGNTTSFSQNLSDLLDIMNLNNNSIGIGDVKNYSNILVFDSSLNLIMTADSDGDTVDISHADFSGNVRAAQMGDYGIYNTFMNPQSGLTQFLLTHPIISPTGEFQGIIALLSNAESISHFLNDSISQQESYVSIADSSGMIFYSDMEGYVGHNMNEFGLDALPMGILSDHTSPLSGIEKMVFITTSNTYDWNVISFLKADDMDSIPLRVFFMLLPTTGGILLACFLVILIINRSLKPLDDLAIAAREIAAGNLAVNIKIPNNDEISQVSRSFLDIIQSLNTLHHDFMKAETDIQEGRIQSRIEETKLQGIFLEISSSANSVMKGFENCLNLISEPLMFVDKDLRVMFINKAFRKITNTISVPWDNIVDMHINDFLNFDLANHPATIKAFSENKPQLETKIQMELADGRILDFEYNCIPFKHKGNYVGSMMLLTNITHIINMQRHTQKLNTYRHERVEKLTNTIISAFQRGNLAIKIPSSSFDSDTEEIAHEQDAIENIIRNATNTIKDYIDEITALLGQVADNNFNIKIHREYIGDFDSIRDSIISITRSISLVIEDIKTAAQEVEIGAEQIAESTSELMASFEEQSAVMADTGNAIDILTDKTLKNAKAAKSANELSRQVQNAATSGNGYMKEMSDAMEEIRQSSSEIAKIVNIIEEIALQTSLLSLNASIEAARAKEHGKGFGVVAEEVRSLAARSASAARDTSDILAKTLSRVETGALKTLETTEAFKNIVDMTDRVADVVSDIAHSSDQQAKEIEKLQSSMGIIYQSASNNANSVETNASVTEELAGQASVLRSLVGRFKTLESR
ncbi:MAG: methyl-accepting chemotaxis protein [Defluviitaleaceae bacterium]|nr:methyl-accepting chemotaxis protein [Defluviitaleaceae bacterium]